MLTCLEKLEDLPKLPDLFDELELPNEELLGLLDELADNESFFFELLIELLVDLPNEPDLVELLLGLLYEEELLLALKVEPDLLLRYELLKLPPRLAASQSTVIYKDEKIMKHKVNKMTNDFFMITTS